MRERKLRLIVHKIYVMKKTYHLCLSAGDEVLFRDQDDYNRGFNCFALALYKTGSTGLVESFMSTHCHLMAETEDPYGLMYSMRMPYSKYFNYKYSRQGRLGEKDHFQIDIVGFHHKLSAVCYTLRNAVHHGVAPIPYAYKNSTVNSIFRQAMGKSSQLITLPQRNFYRHIGKRAEYPDTYKMDQSGLFIRESVLDIAQIENMFGTPRAFDYYMNRKTSDEWTKEQSRDNNGLPPITLKDIENGITTHSLSQMLMHENGKSDYRKISDIELCTLIDKQILSEFGKTSVYQLSLADKRKIAENLYSNLRIGEGQIRRCLALFE